MDYVTFFRIIVHEFRYIDVLSHALKSGIAIIGRQLLFFIAKKKQKNLVQKKAITSHCFIYLLAILHIVALIAFSSSFASRIDIFDFSGSLSLILFRLR